MGLVSQLVSQSVSQSVSRYIKLQPIINSDSSWTGSYDHLRTSPAH